MVSAACLWLHIDKLGEEIDRAVDIRRGRAFDEGVLAEMLAAQPKFLQLRRSQSGCHGENAAGLERILTAARHADVPLRLIGAEADFKMEMHGPAST